MLTLRLEGDSYSNIARLANISRQRIQQILSPPKVIRDTIVKKAFGKCADCQIHVGESGHIHHRKNDFDHYQDIENLELLCISCHRKRHSIQIPVKIKERMKRNRNGNLKTNIQLRIETADALKEVGKFTETYDDVISRLLGINKC